MIAQPELITSRLRLRPFIFADAQQVFELVNDPLVCQSLRSFSYPYSIEDAQGWLKSLPEEWEQGRSATFAICERGDSIPDILVGTIGVVIDHQSNRGELGYWVGRRYWGRKIATEAGFSVLDFAFNELGLNKVVAECLEQNPASARVLENLGMAREGFLSRHFRKQEGDDYSNVLVYGILRRSWNNRK